MARIRTIKPEFWQNVELAALPEHARLLAIALLNHCDDAGYFKANPFLVRAACTPFDDDSEKIRRSLQELSSIGFVEVRTDGTKDIGHVCTFLDHQRIDKPQASKLEDEFLAIDVAGDDDSEHSANVPGSVDERSANTQRLEQGTGKGKEQGNGRGKEQGNGNSSRASEKPKPEIGDQVGTRRPTENAAKVPAATPETVFEYFTASAAATKPRALSEARRKKLKVRLSSPDWPWREAIDKLPIPNDAKFTFQPDLDWLIENDTNARKVAEGRYDRTTPKPSSGTRHDPKTGGFGDGF